MNNPIGALSEIDRLGQAALDAIWREEACYGPHKQEITRLLHNAPEDAGEETLDQMAVLMGVPDRSAVMKKAFEIFSAGMDRERAVNQYVMARRLLTQAGLL